MTRPRGCRAGRPPESPSAAPGEPFDDTTVAAAGPRRSVPSLLEEHPRRAPRRFTLRARAGALLLAVAGFLALAAPAEAQTETEIWSATLYPEVLRPGFEFGCDNGAARFKECSFHLILTDDDFVHDGVTYTINSLSTTTSGSLLLTFTSVTGAAAVAPLTLHVGSTTLAFADGSSLGDGVAWFFSGVSWPAYDPVDLSITAVEPPTDTTPPALESATVAGRYLHRPRLRRALRP